MEVGVRTVTVLNRFEPFGLTVEASDNGNDKRTEKIDDKYQYFLFDPEITRDRNDVVNSSATSALCDDYDHEIFIRGKHIAWSSSSRVFKRFSAPTTIIKVCWCRMESISEPLLCVLHLDSLTTYSPSGEMVSVPLPPTTSIWPLPFGLLLQKADEVSHLCSGGLGRARDGVATPMNNYASTVQRPAYHDHQAKFSHYILKHPLEEPQALLVEEMDLVQSTFRVGLMKDPEEQILWTSDVVPYIASYHKGKMIHSLWEVKILNSTMQAGFDSPAQSVVSIGEQSQPMYLHRMWRDKSSQSIANQVLLATDDDGVLLICFVLKERKRLISLRLECKEKSEDTMLDISWSIPAIVAAPIVITRPRLKTRGLEHFDLLILAPDGNLFLYVGRNCLSKYVLPPSVLSLQHSSSKVHGKTIGVQEIEDKVEIVGLSNAVRGRINLMASSGQVFRCALRAEPASTMTEDCINALAGGLCPQFFQQFQTSFWGYEGSAPSAIDFKVDTKWEAFSSVIKGWIKNVNSMPTKQKGAKTNSAWEFLLCSKMHENYMKNTCFTGLSLSPTLSSVLFSESDLIATASSTQDASIYIQMLFEVLDSLHAVYEDYKLDILHRRNLSLLVVLLTNIATCLGEANYVDHYVRDFPGLLLDLPRLGTTNACRNPPNLFQWLQNCLEYGCSFKNKESLPALLSKEGNIAVEWSRKVIAFYSLMLGCERTGQKLESGVFFNVATGTANTPEQWTVLSMVAEGFGLQQLDRLPSGVALPLRHALDRCRESPPVDWPALAYVLVGREDLASTTIGCSISVKSPYKADSVSAHINFIAMSAPYTLHLRSVIVSSSTTDLHEVVDPEIEKVDSAGETVTDGMEHMFNTTTQLRFGRDLRLNEVKRLLCSARPVALQMVYSPEDQSQQAALFQLVQRTTALPFGRGAFTLATTWTLLTEALIVPKLVLEARFQNRSTAKLYGNNVNIEDITSWPEFHNGVASGLRITPFQEKISRTWIMYNKPKYPSFSHAGFLMALGLHGHLQVLSTTDVYDYLLQEHQVTTLGMIIGVAASHRGTMHPSISKMLYLHLPSRHPPSFPELEMPTQLQCAALMAVGLLYQESAHPMTMKILLDEIGRRSKGDNVLEREGYSVAAGLALGLVTLGRGTDASGFADTLVERLFQYISGCLREYKETLYPSSRPRHTLEDEFSENTCLDMHGSTVNVHVTAPAAILALALMFLKTECQAVASRLSVPTTHYGLQFVKPDFSLLRVIACNMILWERIRPSKEWIMNQVPTIVKDGLKKMEDDTADSWKDPNANIEILVQTFVSIVTGACLSIGLRYAGTANADAQEVLHYYSIYLLNEIKPVAPSSGLVNAIGLSKHVYRATLETCLDVVILSLSLVMAGTGHLQTFRLLRYLRSRTDVHGHISYGNHMAISLAIGFLFLGGGMRTFATNKNAVAALLISLYPNFPRAPDDNRCYLQAFRHFYVLATEARCVQTVDVDTGLTVYTPLKITMRETCCHAETTFCQVTPCILPERSVLKRVQVCGPRYWPQDIELSPADKLWWGPRDKDDPFNGGILYVKRKVGACSYADDPTGCQSLLSRVMQKVSDGSKELRTATSFGKRHGPGLSKIDQLVSTFSADPSLLAFAQLCCDSTSKNGTDSDFQEFCVQVLFECISTDRPALLQTYLYLYTTVGSLADYATVRSNICNDTLDLSSLKVAVAYCRALVDGNLHNTKGELIQSTFVASLAKRVEDILNYWQCSQIQQSELYSDLIGYLMKEKWPLGPTSEHVLRNLLPSLFLAFYLRWYDIPPARVVNSAVQKIIGCFPKSLVSAPHTRIPLLALALPGTHVSALVQIDQCFPFAS